MRFRDINIEATAYTLPEEVLKSAEIESQLSPIYESYGLELGYLEQLTGIKERRIWPVGTKPSKLAAMAGRQAMDRAQVKSGDIDLVIHCGVCRDASEPSTANIIHHALGLEPDCQAFDISNACLGFMNGMIVAANMIALKQVKTALVVSGETTLGPFIRIRSRICWLIRNRKSCGLRLPVSLLGRALWPLFCNMQASAGRATV